jgi:hypothetical protein
MLYYDDTPRGRVFFYPWHRIERVEKLDWGLFTQRRRRGILRSWLAHRFMLDSSVLARVWTGQGHLPGFLSFPLRVSPAPTSLCTPPS